MYILRLFLYCSFHVPSEVPFFTLKLCVSEHFWTDLDFKTLRQPIRRCIIFHLKIDFIESNLYKPLSILSLPSWKMFKRATFFSSTNPNPHSQNPPRGVHWGEPSSFPSCHEPLLWETNSQKNASPALQS